MALLVIYHCNKVFKIKMLVISQNLKLPSSKLLKPSLENKRVVNDVGIVESDLSPQTTSKTLNFDKSK